MPSTPTNSEKLRAAPDKWQKYEVLEEFGLAPVDYMSKTVHRYRWEDRQYVVSELERTLESQREFCVVKLVPRRLSYLLPNYRIYTVADLEGLIKVFARPTRQFDEVWFCRTIIDASAFSVAGRVIVDRRAGDAAQVIEQVWRCSPRLIESIGHDFPFPYVRATRPNWAWSPQVKDIFLPAGWKSSEFQLRADFGRSLQYMYAYRERIIDFENFLFKCGCDAISLEYKIERNDLRFIDWDTHQDGHILRCWRNRTYAA
jgi:hypothetical protein